MLFLKHLLGIFVGAIFIGAGVNEFQKYKPNTIQIFEYSLDGKFPISESLRIENKESYYRAVQDGWKNEIDQCQQTEFTFEGAGKSGKCLNLNFNLYKYYSALSYKVSISDFHQHFSTNRKSISPKLKQYIASSTNIKVLISGDSIISGGNTTSKIGIWPAYPGYSKSICEHYRFRCDFKTFPGRSLAGFVEDLDRTVFNHDVMILAWGMNDQAISQPTSDFIRNVKMVTDKFFANGGKYVLLVPIIYSYSQWNRSNLDLIKAYNSELYRMQARDAERLSVLPVNELWEKIREKKDELELLSEVNHPNDFGHILHYLTFRVAMDL